MPVAKLTCPECRAVLRPSKPLPEGKPVKCPKCGADFVARDADADKVRAKKPAPARAAGAPPKPKPAEDEDEGGPATYGVVSDPAEEEAKPPKRSYHEDDEDEDDADEDEEGGTGVKTKDYLPDDKIRDPRGPAQEAVVKPSNQLLLVSIVLIIIQVVSLGYWAFPFVFSEYFLEPKDYKDAGGQPLFKDELKGPPAKKYWSELSPEDRKTLLSKAEKKSKVEEQEEEAKIFHLIWMGLAVPGLVYGAFMAVGAVKMQNMESWGWSLTGSLMAAIPASAGFGYLGLLWLAGFLAGLDDDYGIYLANLPWAAYALWVILVGTYCVRTLLKPEVKEGFYFVPD